MADKSSHVTLEHDKLFMRECLSLAIKANPSPNPRVGCVIVKNGKILGYGYHKKAGTAHAEINAIASAKTRGYERALRGATLYVNLEPCCIHGRTPPCTDAINHEGFARVVVGCLDKNPRVKGKGIAALKKSKIQVTVSILEDECKQINEAFFKYIKTGMPFVTMKNAMTLDGNIATRTGSSQWISGKESLRLAHQLRAQNDAILISAGTVLKDNPHLTVRLARGKDPLRVIIDRDLRVPISAKVFADRNVIVVTTKDANKKKQEALVKKRVPLLFAPFLKTHRHHLDLAFVLRELGKRGIISVLVEGGSSLNASMLRAHLAGNRVVDKLVFVIAPKLVGDGVPVIGDVGITDISKAIPLRRIRYYTLGQDIVYEAYFHRS